MSDFVPMVCLVTYAVTIFAAYVAITHRSLKFSSRMNFERKEEASSQVELLYPASVPAQIENISTQNEIEKQLYLQSKDSIPNG